MKKFLFVIGMLIAFASASHAQGYAYTYIRNYAQGMGYGIGQEWNCGLEQGQSFTKTFNFKSGVTYDIVALSDDGSVLDVDVEILTPSGYLYDRNSRTGKFAEVVFTPTYDRNLTIKVKNNNSETPYYASRVYFMIAYK